MWCAEWEGHGVASRHAAHHHHVPRAALQWSLGVRVETEVCALLVARKLPRLSAFLGTLQLPPATLIQVSWHADADAADADAAALVGHTVSTPRYPFWSCAGPLTSCNTGR
jgi:hypothetical protein